MMKKYKDIDSYIKTAPKEAQPLLRQMRAAIRKAAPKAEEVISYGMPAYKQNGILVYFGSFKTHVGFFPTASGISAFKKEMAKFESSKGAVRFPLDKPLPLSLVKKIVVFRTKETSHKVAKKK
ncbi:MAG TPA: DUF1801 domain-containing protein [Candidatus Paceibacterota bacterium]